MCFGQMTTGKEKINNIVFYLIMRKHWKWGWDELGNYLVSRHLTIISNGHELTSENFHRIDIFQYPTAYCLKKLNNWQNQKSCSKLFGQKCRLVKVLCNRTNSSFRIWIYISWVKLWWTNMQIHIIRIKREFQNCRIVWEVIG